MREIIVSWRENSAYSHSFHLRPFPWRPYVFPVPKIPLRTETETSSFIMKTLLKFAMAAVVASAIMTPAISFAQDAPAQEEEAKQVEVTGTLVKDDGKFKLKEDKGKTYLVTKNNDEKVASFEGKKVKISGKAKSKEGANGKPWHMIVYVKSIEEVAAE